MKKLVLILSVTLLLINNVSVAQDTTSIYQDTNVNVVEFYSDIQTQINNLQQALEDFQKRIDAKQDEIDQWADSVKTLSAIIAKSDKKNEKLEAVIDSLNNLIEQNNDIIEALNDGIENINDDIEELQDELREVDTVLNFQDIDEWKDKDKFRGHWDGVQLGLNALYFPNSSCANIEGYCENSLYEENLIKSWEFSFNPVQFSIPFFNRYVGAVTGVGFTWNNYEYANNYVVMKNPVNQTNVSVDSSNFFDKNRFKTASLNVPLIIEFQIRTNKDDDRFYIGLGVIGNYNYSAKMKYVYSYEGLEIKTKDKMTDFHLNKFTYTVTAKIGYKSWYLYANYNPMPIFDNHVVAANKISLGVGLKF